MRKSQRKQQKKSRNNRVVVENKQTKAEKAKKNPFTSESPGKAKG